MSTLTFELKIEFLGVWRYQEVSFEYETTFGQIIEGLHVDLAKIIKFRPLLLLNWGFVSIRKSVLTIKIRSNKSGLYIDLPKIVNIDLCTRMIHLMQFNYKRTLKSELIFWYSKRPTNATLSSRVKVYIFWLNRRVDRQLFVLTNFQSQNSLHDIFKLRYVREKSIFKKNRHV